MMFECFDYMKRSVPCGIEQPVPLPESFASEWWLVPLTMALVFAVRAWRERKWAR